MINGALNLLFEAYLLITRAFFQVHFRSGIESDSQVTQSAEELIIELGDLNATVKSQTAQLETAISQVDGYQQEVQQLRQQIVQVEQHLRSTMAPTYLPHDRDQALRDQQVRYPCGFSLVLTQNNYCVE